MPTTYTNGLKLPDLGSIDWFNAYKNNIDILDPIVGTVNGVATTYAPISHNHDASEITSGTIDIARLPPAALERLTTVADQTARYALTTSTVQLGDTVKQLDTGIMYLVVDTTKLNSADGYVEYSAGTASKAIADEDGTSIKTGYGKLAGNQTWTGSNTFNASAKFKDAKAIQLIDPNDVSTTQPASTVTRQLEFDDNTGNVQSYIAFQHRADATETHRICFRQNKINSTGYWSFNLNVLGQLYPEQTGMSLGTSSYQWSSVYAQTYYYNGTQWGLDKENTWTQNQIIASGTNDKCYYVKDTVYELGQDYSNGEHLGGLTIQDKNGATVGLLDIVDRSYGNMEMRIRVQQKFDPNSNNRSTSGDTLFNELILGITPTKTNYIGFNANLWGANHNLGTSTNKWKTLNGVNPGALSLPDASNSVNIDTTGWVTDGTAWNIITSSSLIDGYLYINYSQCSADDYIAVRMRTSSHQNLTFCCLVNTTAAGNHYLYACVPVSKLFYVFLEIKTTGTLQKARIFPMLGNV